MNTVLETAGLTDSNAQYFIDLSYTDLLVILGVKNEAIALTVKFLKSCIIMGADRKKGYVWNFDNNLWEQNSSDSCRSKGYHMFAEYVTQKRIIEEATLEKKARDEYENKRIQDQEDIKWINPEVPENYKRFKRQRPEYFLEKHNVKRTRNASTWSKIKVFTARWPDISATLNNESFWLEHDKKYTHLFPLRNSLVVDLRDGQTYPRTKDMWFTFESPVTYTGNMLYMPIPHVEQFFESIMAHAEKRAYLQTQLGYYMTGEMNMNKFFIWIGEGANGKSALAKLVGLIFGRYYRQLTRQACVLSGASSQIMPWVDSRVVVASESGRDTRAVRGLCQAAATQAKVLLVTNHLPIMDFTDTAVNVDVEPIYFRARFVDTPSSNELKKDDNLVESLKSVYLHEVFIWMLKGAIRYYKLNKNLQYSTAVLQDFKTVLNEIDTVSDWLQSCCGKRNEQKWTPRPDIHDSYRSYCQTNRVKGISKKKLFKELKVKRFALLKRNGTMGFRGINILG